MDAADCWPQNAAQEVHRHERNLGMVSAEVTHELEPPVEHKHSHDRTEEIEPHQHDTEDHGHSL